MESRRSIWSRIKKPLISIAIILAAGMVVVSVARMPAEVEQVEEKEVPPVNVIVEEVTAIPQMADVVELPGTLSPRKVIEVPVELRGRIEEILCQEGQEVREGDLMLRLDTALLQAEFDRAKAQWEFDERTLQRSRELLERGVLNKSQVEESEARAIVSKAVFDVAQTNLERSSVYAPTTGVLNELIREEGEYVAPGDPVAQIVEVEQLKVVILIPERDVQYVHKGTRIPMVVEALNDMRVAGQVTYISEVADEATRTTRIEVTVDNLDRRLRAGLIVKAEIPRRVLRNVVMIPLTSVIPLEEGRVVYVANGDQAERRDIELGILKGSRVQVLQGLNPGDQLIVSGHRQVGPGQSIRIVEPDLNAES